VPLEHRAAAAGGLGAGAAAVPGARAGEVVAEWGGGGCDGGPGAGLARGGGEACAAALDTAGEAGTFVGMRLALGVFLGLAGSLLGLALLATALMLGGGSLAQAAEARWRFAQAAGAGVAALWGVRLVMGHMSARTRRGRLHRASGPPGQ